jgi:hypothetical protein
LRFSELEDERAVAAVREAADALIRSARERFREIGENVWIDGTAFHSRARLHRLDDDEVPVPSTLHRLPQRIEAATDSFLEEHHQSETLAPEAVERISDEAAITTPPGSRFPNVVLVDGNPYGCLDPTAGIRVYRSGSRVIKAWIGGIDLAVVDLFTGLPISNVVIRANQQENKAFFPVMRRLREALDSYPGAFTADRAFSTNRIYHFSARKGIEPVITFRRPNASVLDEQDLRNDLFDEHGPRCQHCGGPATSEGPRLGLQTRRGRPRLYFRCLLQLTKACSSVQSLYPAEHAHGLRILTALPPTTERWHAIRALGFTLERTHRHGRERYGKSGSDQTGKLKRFGLPAQRLHSEAARFLDWFRFCLRHGILGAHARVIPAQILISRGDQKLGELRMARRGRELDLPYGTAALATGWAATAAIPPPLRPEADPRGCRGWVERSATRSRTTGTARRPSAPTSSLR